MKYKNIFILFVSWMAVIACQKANYVPPPASLTVVNAMATGNPIVLILGADTSGSYFNSMVQVNYGSSQLYSPVAGNNHLFVVPITDTGFNIFNGNFSLTSGGIYSFFLSGDTAHADTVLVRDNIPVYSDSSTGIRFINLSLGGKDLTINLAGDSGNLQFPALGYRRITDFKKYNATASAGSSYNFEIRDLASGILLYTYNWSFSIYNNNTIVIAGSTDPLSPTPLNIFTVNNY